MLEGATEVGSNRFFELLASFLTAFLFAVSAVSGQRSARWLGGTRAHFWRLLLATILLGVYAHVATRPLEGTAFPVFLLSGAIGFGVGDLALFQALPRIGSRLSTILVLCLSSPLAALAEWVWLGTSLDGLEGLCVGLILVGVTLALAPRENPHLARSTLLAGMAFGLVAALCQAAGAVLSRHAFLRAAQGLEDISGMIAAYQRILGGLFITAGWIVLRRSWKTWWRPSADPSDAMADTTRDRTNWGKAWPWVVLNGMAGPALGVSCFQSALKTTPTGVVLPVVALTPLMVIPLVRILDNERPTPRSLWGACLAVVGAAALAWLHAR